MAKFASSVVDTGGYFAAGVIDTAGKFATGVVDTGGAPWLANISVLFKLWNYLIYFSGMIFMEKISDALGP